MNSCGDYISHYRLDAEHFDYFDIKDRSDLAYEHLFHKFVAKLAGKRSSVLDIGSGSGWTSNIPHRQIFFVDLSHKNLSELKSDLASPVMADANHLPFKDASHEFVIASEILEHLNHPEEAAREIWRVLKPGGKAIISTPYKEKIRYSLCIHCNKVTPMNAHLHSFDRPALASLFIRGEKEFFFFGSKLLVLLQLPRLVQRLPLWVWRIMDYPALRMTDKAQHIILVLQK